MRTVCAVQHIHCETIGTIADPLKMEGIVVELVRTFAGQSVPQDIGKYDGLIVMGGPMGVYEQDRYAHLRGEIRLIEQALVEKKPILGVCLGSQLLAAALGARVFAGKQKEIGWFPVALTPAAARDRIWADVQASFTAYIWHGDIFDLPRNAVSLASSELTECQAFRYGKNAYGILFHMEVTERIIKGMVTTFAGELRAARVDGREIVEKTSEHLSALQKIGISVFRRWAELVKSGEGVR